MTRKNDVPMEELMQEIFLKEGGVKELLEILLNKAMDEELDSHINAGWHERTDGRKGYRNGRKPRKLKTRVGELDIEVPQSRGCEPYHPSMYAHWQRSERALLVACGEMYFQGVSTRKVQKVLQEMCDMDISSSTVSRIAMEIDERLKVFRNRKLTVHEYPYVMIDARYESVRVNGHVVSQAALVTVGIDEQGKREVLDWRMGDSESEDTWGEVFRSLKARGLKGVKLVISDCHKGIRAAMTRYFQGVCWQRCTVHFKREMRRKAASKYHRELMSDIKLVLGSNNRKESMQLGEEMALRWEKKYPKIAKMIREGLEDCLTTCGLPEQERKQLYSTNMIESQMKELKRRTRVVGVFPNRASCDRLIGAQLLELHEKWQTSERPYLQIDRIQEMECERIPVELEVVSWAEDEDQC